MHMHDDNRLTPQNTQTVSETRRGGITAPEGFTAHGLSAGIRKSGKKDLAVIVAEEPAAAAGVFTTNKVQAAPVILTRRHLKAGGGLLRGVIVNSGVANACTGDQGMKDALATAATAADLLDAPVDQIAVASTGLIGAFLPMAKLLAAIGPGLAGATRAGHAAAAEAIMTTDTVSKEATHSCTLSDGTVITLGSMTKGAAMIHPSMATMLCFVTTDARISAPALQQAVQSATGNTFNMVSIDGDMSTNDMVLAMASGRRGPLIDGPGEDYDRFLAALTNLQTDMAKAIARDGEGSSRMLEVRVRGAAAVSEARTAARAIVSSTLVKAALFGKDANWGRIMMALGASGAAFNLDTVDLWVAGFRTMNAGQPVPLDEAALEAALGESEVIFELDLNLGEHSATAWGCDLTYEYVRLNAEYRT